MPAFDDALHAALVQGCQERAADLAASLSSAAETPLQLDIGAPSPLASAPLPLAPGTPGWLLRFAWDGPSILLALPQTDGLLAAAPADSEPAANWTRRWQNAAQELGFGLFPDTPPDVADLEVCDSLTDALQAYTLAPEATALPWTLTGGDQSATGYLLWPAARTGQADGNKAAPNRVSASDAPPPGVDEHDPFAALPQYTRSLLKIKVPVMVTLASKKERVADILHIAPGSLLQFDKTCDSLLTLEVRNKPIAVGEAVKVEDRFGLRITSITLPSERYLAVKSTE